MSRQGTRTAAHAAQALRRAPACSGGHQRKGEREEVARLRAACRGRPVGDPAWTGFIRRMEAASPEFAAMWATQDVAQPAS